MRKGFVLPLIVGLVIGVIITFAYFVLKPKIQPKITKNVKQEDTAWKVYQNLDFGYELKYPPDWIIDAPAQFRPDISIYHSQISESGAKNLSEAEQLEIINKSASVRIIVSYAESAEISFNKIDEDLKQWKPDKIEESESWLADIPARFIKLSFDQGGRKWNALYTVALNRHAKINYGNKNYSIATYQVEGVFGKNTDEDIYNKILSTFKFLN